MPPLARRLAWLAVLAALATASLAIVRASTAALSPGHADVWSSGELVLADEPVRAGLFDAESMLPGQPEVRCVVVRYDGVRADVRLYATAVRGGLAPFLDVVVETGRRCDGFAPESVAFSGTLEGMPASWSAARPGPGAGRDAPRAYRVTVTLRADPAAEGLDATAGFVWEARDSREASAPATLPTAGRT